MFGSGIYVRLWNFRKERRENFPGGRAGGRVALGAGWRVIDRLDRANLIGLVLGSIEAKFCNKICVLKLSPRSTQRTPLHYSTLTFVFKFAIICPKNAIFSEIMRNSVLNFAKL